jgi:hypothetical protein
MTEQSQLLPFDSPAIEIDQPKDDAHRCTSIESRTSSNPFENHVNVLHIRLVIYHSFLDLNPRMRLEGENLCADHEHRVIAMALQEQGRGRGTLETQDLLEIKNAREVGGAAKLLSGWRSPGGGWRHLLPSNHFVKFAETSKAHDALQQQNERPTLNHEPIHL